MVSNTISRCSNTFKVILKVNWCNFGAKKTILSPISRINSTNEEERKKMKRSFSKFFREKNWFAFAQSHHENKSSKPVKFKNLCHMQLSEMMSVIRTMG